MRGEEEQGSAAEFSPQAETEESGLCDDEAGPVLAYGTAASVVYGLILWIIEQL
ncbi:MAG TPA: hypothetical protein IAC25_00460 [Candidatus Enterenecus stercoripullorum]|nr:hypothetical protein [Candidatus Enterenecus stercoripullorum]